MTFLEHDIGNLSAFNGDGDFHLTAVSGSASLIDAVRVSASAFFRRVRAARGSLAEGVLNRFPDARAGHARSARGINFGRLRFNDGRNHLIHRHLIDARCLRMTFLKHDIRNLSVLNGDIHLHLTAVSVSCPFIDTVRIQAFGICCSCSLCLGFCLCCRLFRFCFSSCRFCFRRSCRCSAFHRFKRTGVHSGLGQRACDCLFDRVAGHCSPRDVIHIINCLMIHHGSRKRRKGRIRDIRGLGLVQHLDGFDRRIGERYFYSDVAHLALACSLISSCRKAVAGRNDVMASDGCQAVIDSA